LGLADALHATATQPAAHIEDKSTPLPAPQSEDTPMGAIALPLLTSLIPQVLQLFSGRAQAQLGKVTGDPAAAGAFMQSMIAKVGDVVGVPVTDDTTAV